MEVAQDDQETEDNNDPGILRPSWIRFQRGLAFKENWMSQSTAFQAYETPHLPTGMEGVQL